MDKNEVLEAIAYLRKYKTETDRIEAKTAKGGFPKRCYDTFSSFSNKYGGLIIFGLSEDKDFATEGVYDVNDLQKQITDLCSDSMEPTIRPDILAFEFEGKNILAVKVEETLQNNNIDVIIYDGTVPNPTTTNVLDALKLYQENNCQALIAFGGGSVMDCAKAVGAKVARPNKTLKQMKGVLKIGKRIPLLIAVPTTAGTGSETTLAAVITDSETRHKYAINDFPLIPSFALLNPALTVNLPKHITSTTGMDALTHAIEAYIGKSTTKQTRKCALSAIKIIFS